MKKSAFLILFVLLVAGISFASLSGSGGGLIKLNFTEVDGSPSVFPYQVKVSNGTLTDNGDGTASISTSGTTHSILSATHTDSTAASVVRGDLITGQGATPTWSRLAIGAANRLLRSNGTDASWAQVALGTDVTGTLGIANGGTNNSTAYTAGSVIFSNGTSLTQNNANLFWDNTNNRLGIGTASPSTLLHVGLAGTTLGTIGVAGNTSGLVTIRPAAAAGTWTMTLPTTAGTNGYVLQTDGTGITSWVAGGGLTVGTTTIASGTSTRVLYDNAGVLGEYTLTGTGTVVAMQTAPTFLTSITDPLVIGGTSISSSLSLRSTSGVGTTDAIIFQVGNNGATEASRILNNGNVGVGTTTPNGNSTPGTVLTVSGSRTSARGTIQIETAQADAAGNIAGFDYLATANTAAANTSIGTFQCTTKGTTANNRGSAFLIYNKPDGGALTERFHIYPDGGYDFGAEGTTPGKGRISLKAGTNVATTDWALSAGWGANATVSAVSGNDSRGTVTVTTSIVDTPGANPNLTLTFKDGTWTSTPFAVACLNRNGTGLTGPVELSISATGLTLEFIGTPTALTSETYIFNYIVEG